MPGLVPRSRIEGDRDPAAGCANIFENVFYTGIGVLGRVSHSLAVRRRGRASADGGRFQEDAEARMRKLVVANWKLNPRTLAEGKRLVRALAPAARASRAE